MNEIIFISPPQAGHRRGSTSQMRARSWAQSTRLALAASLQPHELDNRGSTFYLTLHRARALATQSDDPELAERFAPLASALSGGEEQILAGLNGAQGPPQDVGGGTTCPIPRAPPRPCARAPP